MCVLVCVMCVCVCSVEDVASALLRARAYGQNAHHLKPVLIVNGARAAIKGKVRTTHTHTHAHAHRSTHVNYTYYYTEFFTCSPV